MATVERGFYQHWKGGIYFVLGVAVRDADGVEEVVYESIQDVGKAELRTRTVEDFTATVETNPIAAKDNDCPHHVRLCPDEPCTCPHPMPRFQRVRAWERKR